MRGEPMWPGETDVDQICIIKKSLGKLTTSQTQTLMTQNIYDQVSKKLYLHIRINRTNANKTNKTANC